MLRREMSLRWLLSPMSVGAFLEGEHGERPLHVPGPADKFAEVFSWSAFNRLLDTSSTWTGQKVRLVRDAQLVPEAQFCRPAHDRALGSILRPVPQLIAAHLEQGATVNLNEVELLDEGLASVSCSLAMAFAAHVACNIYASRQDVPAFASHFDPTDVYVLHLHGEKVWRIYANRFEEAADLPGYTSGSFPDEHHERHKGPVLAEIAMTPGDFLYIPKGFYHDALASDGPTLHLTYGVDELRGLAVVEVLQRSLPDEALFRQALPDPDDETAHRAHLARLGGRLAEILAMPEVSSQIRALQKNQAFWDLPGFALPSPEFDQLFRLRAPGTVLERDGETRHVVGAGRRLAVAAEQAPICEWLLEGDYFETESLLRAFPQVPQEAVMALVGALVGAGLIEEIGQYVA